MAGFILSIGDSELVAVSSDDLNIVQIRVRGDVIGEEMATVDVSGGNYGSGAENSHLIWLDCLPITAQDTLKIQFHENVTNSKPGKTIEQLYPEREPNGQPFLTKESIDSELESLAEDISQKPKLRQRFELSLSSQPGKSDKFATKPGDFAFSLSVMWKWTKPANASLWLTTTTIENIAKQRNGDRLIRRELNYDDKITFAVGAQ